MSYLSLFPFPILTPLIPLSLITFSPSFESNVSISILLATLHTQTISEYFFVMIKPPMGSWPLKGRTLGSNGTLLALLALLIFYYVCWNTLSYPTRYESSQVLGSEAPTSEQTCLQPSAAPACPPLPAPVACPAQEPCPLPPSPYDPQKVAFLVETRPLPHLPALYAHMTAILPPEWTFKFMGSPPAIIFLRSSPIINRLEASGKLGIIPLPANHTLTNRETVSQLFTDIKLYRDILSPAEHLFVFQPDSIFCANAPKTINDYLEFDWIGAPWSPTAKYGGNGGLSLRNIKKIVQILEKQKRRIGDGALEDLWLSERLRKLPGARMANATVSKGFSVESVWDERPLGFHVGWLGVHHEQIWDDQKQVDHVLEYCPEVKMILGMKLDNDKPKGIS